MATFGATMMDSTQQALGMAADEAGVYVTGVFSRDFTAGAQSFTALSGDEGFLVALEPDLSRVKWAARAQGRQSSNDNLRAIALSGEHVWVGGFFAAGTGVLKPNIGPLDSTFQCEIEQTIAGLTEGVVAALDTKLGHCELAVLVGGVGLDHVRALHATETGVLATGFTDGIEDFDPSLTTDELSRNGFVASIDIEGTLEGRLIGGTSLDYVEGAAPNPDGTLVFGSYGAPFDVLDRHDDFFVGVLLP